MKEFFQIAGQVAGLGGISIIVFLAISKAIVSKTRDVNQGQSFTILNRLLILAGIITVLGMVSWLISLAVTRDASVRLKELDVKQAVAQNTRTARQHVGREQLFGAQFNELRQLIARINGKSEDELRRDFAFDEMLQDNARYLVGIYKARVQMRPEEPIHEDFFKAPCVIRSIKGPPPNTSVGDFHGSKNEPVIQVVRVPEKFETTCKQLDMLASSPLIPSEVRDCLSGYVESARVNVSILENVLNKCAKQFPTKYANAEEPNGWNFIWIHNQFFGDMEKMEPKAIKVLDSIRQHWRIEELGGVD